MTQQQRDFITPLLLSLSQIKTMEQLEALWPVVVQSFRIAGISPGNKPTSVPQAKSLANSLRKRVLG